MGENIKRENPRINSGAKHLRMDYWGGGGVFFSEKPVVLRDFGVSFGKKG